MKMKAIEYGLSFKEYEKIRAIAKQLNVHVEKIGSLVSDPEISINGLKSGVLKLDVDKMKELYDLTIPNLMEI